MAAELGRLTSVPARQVWPHEAQDFTPWLLQNVDVLSDLLGMDLVLDVAEHPVGGFSLDLLGRDEATDRAVIVENQLEPSDHLHLGQILTYAAGTDPATIVWIATSFREEHRAAIDWLNERTNEDTRFFGVEIDVVRIGDSTPAPNFRLVAKPNDWGKQVKAAVTPGPADERAKLRREFWEATLQQIRERHPSWTRARTTADDWCDVPTGVGGVKYSMAWTKDGLVEQVWFGDRDPAVNDRRFEAVLAHRETFESLVGPELRWERMEGRKATKIVLPSPYPEIEDRAQWSQMAEWLIAKQELFRKAFDAIGGIPQIASDAFASPAPSGELGI